MKANERDSRTEQERFIDRMLKEILGGQRNPGDRLPTESELAAQYDLRKTNVHLALKELERLGFLEIVPRHATYVAPYWEKANLETLAVIMTHGVTPHPELVDAFLELREMVALGWFRWAGRRPNAAQMQKLYGLLTQMDAIAYVPDGDKAAFLELLNAFLVCMFRESDNMIFRVMLRSTRELAHVAYYMVAYTLDMQELCRVYRAVLDGLTDGCVPEAIACWSAWSDRVTLRYREVLEQLQSVEQYVEMVLGYLRLESPSSDYVIRNYALDDIVRQAVRKYASQFIRRRLRLEYTPLNVSVITDEKWLLFVIEQVLSNALKYTRSGSVSITLEAPKTLCIRDTGIGIAPEDLPRVFEKGFTGCNGRTDKRATGIGLYLCRRILEKLGHTIAITSTVGEGTTVRIGLQQDALEVE